MSPTEDRPPAPPTASFRLPDIELLRGLAILLVLLHHVSLPATLLALAPLPLASPFYVGVELFFVISGYVVFRSLLRGTLDPFAFLLRRAFRLLPPTLAALALAALVNELLITLNQPYPWGLAHFTVAPSVLLEQSIAILKGTFVPEVTKPAYPFSAMWSLAIEMQFYAAVAAVLGVMAFYSWPQRWRRRALCLVAALAVATGIGARLMTQVGLPLGALQYPIAWRLDFMAAGALLAFVPETVLGHLRRRLGAAGLAAAVLLPLLMLPLLRGDTTAAPAGPDLRDGLAFLTVQAAALLAVALAATGCLERHRQHAAYRSLHWLGERSFAIYLTHFTVMALVWRLIVGTGLHIEESAWAYGVCQLLLTGAVLLPLVDHIHQRIEKPATALGRRLGPAPAGAKSLTNR